MKQFIMRKALPLFAVLCILLMVILSPTGYAAADTSRDTQHIYDKAGLLSTSELTNMEDMCIEYSIKDKVDIIILTHNDSNAVYAEQYISDFYDKMLYANCIILLVDMNSRDVFIEDYGSIAKSHISSGRIDTIISEITPYLTAKDYTTAFEKYIKSSDRYINTAPIYLNTWIHLAVALVIGAITVTIMAYNSGGKMTVGGSTYMDANNSGLIGRRDDYIRTLVTRVKKPQNNNKGSGGVSAGGHSYNSGGGKF